MLSSRRVRIGLMGIASAQAWAIIAMLKPPLPIFYAEVIAILRSKCSRCGTILNLAKVSFIRRSQAGSPAFDANGHAAASIDRIRRHDTLAAFSL